MELSSLAEDRFIQYRIRKMLKAPSGLRRNTSVAKLLLLYTNKKSGKVVSAREELLHRFPYLDAPQQVRVAEAILDGSLTDVGTMSKYLMGHWDEMYRSAVEKAWLSSPCNDSLAKLIIRYFPLDYVMEHMSELKEFDCPMLAVRRCQAGEQPKIEDWPLTDYLAIIYNSGRSMEEDDAIYLMKSYLISAANYDTELGRVPDYTRKSGIEHPSMIYLEGARLILYYLGGMGFTKALALFETMDGEICGELIHSGFIESVIREEQTSFEEKVSRIWKAFCETVVGWYDEPELTKIKVKENTDVIPCISYGVDPEVESNSIATSAAYSERNFGDIVNGNDEVEGGTPF